MSQFLPLFVREAGSASAAAGRGLRWGVVGRRSPLSQPPTVMTARYERDLWGAAQGEVKPLSPSVQILGDGRVGGVAVVSQRLRTWFQEE